MLIVVIQGLRAWRLPSFFNDTKFKSLANLLYVLMSACVFPLYTVWFRPEKNTSVAFRAKMQEHAKNKTNILVSERSGSENTSRKHTSDA